jgi:hypothetical protein
MSDQPEPFDCGTCRGEPAPPGTLTAREWDELAMLRASQRTPRLTIGERLLEWLSCGECFRLRFSPGHLLTLPFHDSNR